jgi:hypothetical protein
VILVETIFDTLNAKAALFAVDEAFDQTGERLPIIISGTVTDASGRILSGQTVTAFWHSVRHARPLAVGLNCALGAALMRPYIQELAKAAPDTFISCYPNAGLPNPMSDTGFDETPEVTSRLVHEFAAEGLVNIVGGCCGTTPDHIGAIAGQDAPLVLPRGGLRASRCLDLRAKLSDSGRISDSLSPCGRGLGRGGGMRRLNTPLPRPLPQGERELIPSAAIGAEADGHI